MRDGLEFEMKATERLANIVTVGLLILFSINIPEGIWQLSPLWIVLFSRVQGLAFSTVHTTSVYGISLIAAYLVIRDRKTIQPYRWILIIFGSAGLHEWGLYFWDFTKPGAYWGTFAWQDATWFAAFAVLAFVVANPRQRRFLILIGTICFWFEFAYVGYFHDSDLQQGMYTVSAISDNLIEVASWLVIPIGWLFYEA